MRLNSRTSRKPFVVEQCRSRALALDYRVGRYRRAMKYIRDIGQLIRGIVNEAGDSLNNSVGVVLGGRRELSRHKLPVVSQKGDVCKCAANVGGDPAAAGVHSEPVRAKWREVELW